MKKLLILLVALLSIAATPITELTVHGSCGHCKQRIESVANQLKGVSAAQWNAKTGLLTYKLNPAKTSREALSLQLSKAGHDTELHRANDSIYNSLPKCCKYRK